MPEYPSPLLGQDSLHFFGQALAHDLQDLQLEGGPIL